ncbi:MAG: hypothetical protein AB7P20_22780 [Rhizobiaceae bacterium]
MHSIAAGALRAEFVTRATAQREELLRRQREQDRRRERQVDDATDETAEFMDAAMLMISAADAETFRLELDRYDTATVVALQENREALEQVQARMDRLLAKAYVLPDGRRIFKTEDGERVFDEFGAELGRDEIDPSMIEDARPRWETYEPELEQFRALERERAEILDYQEKLDEARQRLDDGDLTRKEYDALRDDLKTNMPAKVRAQIPELRKVDLSAASEPSAPSEDLTISSDMIPSAFKPG